MGHALAANHRSYPWMAGSAALILVVRLAASVGVFSQTIDEPCHVGAAISMVEAHKSIAPVSHPPVSRWVAALPLWIDGARLPEVRGRTRIGKEDLGYELGTKVLFGSPTPYMKLLEHARWRCSYFQCWLWFMSIFWGDGW